MDAGTGRRKPPFALEAGPRAYIRHLAPGDHEEIASLIRESRRLHRPWVHLPSDPGRLGAYLARSARDDFYALLVCRRDDGAIAGVVNLSQIFRGDFQNAYLGYYGRSGFDGQGLMTEGLSLVTRYAFTKLKLHRLEANIQPDNERSIALVRRCGFRKEGFSARYLKVGGRWRDHERWAITIEDWRAARRTR